MTRTMPAAGKILYFGCGENNIQFIINSYGVFKGTIEEIKEVEMMHKPCLNVEVLHLCMVEQVNNFKSEGCISNQEI